MLRQEAKSSFSNAPMHRQPTKVDLLASVDNPEEQPAAQSQSSNATEPTYATGIRQSGPVTEVDPSAFTGNLEELREKGFWPSTRFCTSELTHAAGLHDPVDIHP